MITQYTNHVGIKFHEDGRLRPFPGNSVVCMLQQDSEVVKHLLYVSDFLQQHSYSKRYVFLPQESYHMTLIEGVCDQVRDTKHWTTKIPLSAPLEKVNQFFYECVQNLKPLEDDIKKVSMTYHGLTYHGLLLLRLKCTNQFSEDALKTYRDRFAEATGLHFDTHDSYSFHISLGYQLEQFEENEISNIGTVMLEADKYLKQNLGKITCLQPILSHFPDMGSFPTYSPSQKSIYSNRNSSGTK